MRKDINHLPTHRTTILRELPDQMLGCRVDTVSLASNAFHHALSIPHFAEEKNRLQSNKQGDHKMRERAEIAKIPRASRTYSYFSKTKETKIIIPFLLHRRSPTSGSKKHLHWNLPVTREERHCPHPLKSQIGLPVRINISSQVYVS